MEWKPNKYIAAILGVFTQFFAMLYVARTKLAAIYLIASLAVTGTEWYLSAPWLNFFSFANIIGVICAIHAYRIAATSDPISVQPWYSRWYGLASIYLIVFIGVFSVRSFVYEPFRMPSGSMLPTINVGSYLLVEKYGYGNYGTFGITIARSELTSSISRGDLIAFEYPVDTSVTYVKRVIGVPGDKLEYKNSQLVINGSLVKTESVHAYADKRMKTSIEYMVKREFLPGASYLIQYINGLPHKNFEVTVPEECFFVLGDNRDNSRDSRYWGVVPQENIVGKVVFITK